MLYVQFLPDCQTATRDCSQLHTSSAKRSRLGRWEWLYLRLHMPSDPRIFEHLAICATQSHR